MSGGGSEVPSCGATLGTKEVDGKEQKKKITFNLKGQVIEGKNEFKARGLELLMTHIGLAFDDWRHVTNKKKQDMFETLLLKTWKKNVRNKYFGDTKESILAYKDKVPESVLVSLSSWNTFVDLEATPEKLARRLKAKDDRSKKTDAHYLGRTSYAEKEEICVSVEKRKPDRVELYVDARKNPKTNFCHPGAVSDVGINPSNNPESGGSHNRTYAESGIILSIQYCSEKSGTGNPTTPTFGPLKFYKLLNLDGSKPIAKVTIVKTAPGSVVHGRPMMAFEVKVSVVKVFSGMGNEPLWKSNQEGADTLAETEGGCLVWPKYLMEEVVGENSTVLAFGEPLCSLNLDLRRSITIDIAFFVTSREP
ncbi:hypothetical protein LguiB_027697 [Lonicera macranthoides]